MELKAPGDHGRRNLPHRVTSNSTAGEALPELASDEEAGLRISTYQVIELPGPGSWSRFTGIVSVMIPAC